MVHKSTILQTGGGGGGTTIGSTVTGGTANSMLFIDSSGNLAQDNSNNYFQDSATTPQQLATNTNVALSINTGGDFTGVDALNIYAQIDAYLPNSAITNTLTGFNTDGAFPGYTASSSRGTGKIPVILNTGDITGGFSGWGYTGASPTYQNLAGMMVFATGATANNLGGELRFYTKADGGTLALAGSFDNAQGFKVIGTTTLATSLTGILQATAGVVSTTSAYASSVSNSDSSLTISPTNGAVIASLNVAHANTWTGTQTISTVPLIISGNQSVANWGTAGTQLSVVAATLNNTTSSGTIAAVAANAFAQPTMTANSASTYTVSANVFIAGAPIASTNVTQTIAYSLYVNAGATSLGGTLSVTGNANFSGFLGTTGAFTTANFLAIGLGSVGSSTAAAALLFAGAANVSFRTMNGGSTSSGIGVGVSYSNSIIGSSPVTMAASGVHALFANQVINPLGTVGGSGATITNTSSLFVNGASTATVTGKNYTLWAKGGVSGVVGGLELGRTTVADIGYTVLATDYLVAYTSLTATRAVTLPTASTVTNQFFIIKDEAGTAGTNNITITGTVDGVTNKTINANYGFLKIYSNGTAYFTAT